MNEQHSVMNRNGTQRKGEKDNSGFDQVKTSPRSLTSVETIRLSQVQREICIVQMEKADWGYHIKPNAKKKKEKLYIHRTPSPNRQHLTITRCIIAPP